MKFFRNMSITRKMILICLNICLLPLIIGFMFIYNLYVTRLNEHTMEFAQAFNVQITANLNHMLQDYTGISVSVLVDSELFFYSEKTERTVTEIVRDKENMQKVLFRIVTLQPKVKTIGILMQNGDFVQNGSDGLKIDQAVFCGKPWVKELEQSGENFYIVPAHKADYWTSRKDELTITFVRRIMSSGVRYRGALMIDVDPASIIVLNEKYAL
jgi:two-component system sensor histidine kinase YesM